MAPAPVIRLHPDDGVLIARSSLPQGLVVADVFKKNPFTGDNPLADFPNVDGVVALTHKTGCGMTQDEPLTVLRRTLGGYARHQHGACDQHAIVGMQANDGGWGHGRSP